MEGKGEGGFVCFEGWFVSREHCCDFGCNFSRKGAENEGSTPENINHNIYTTLMFHETEFRKTRRKREQKCIILGHSYRTQRGFLKFGYLTSTKDNVFTVTNSLGTFTVLAKMYQFLVTDVAAFVSGATDVLLLLSIAVHSTRLPPYSLQDLLTRRF